MIEDMIFNRVFVAKTKMISLVDKSFRTDIYVSDLSFDECKLLFSMFKENKCKLVNTAYPNLNLSVDTKSITYNTQIGQIKEAWLEIYFYANGEQKIDLYQFEISRYKIIKI